MHKLNKLDRTTHLLQGEPQTRRDRDRAYMMSMSDENLLRAHYLEAGLIRMVGKPEGIFWGWESPLNDLRGNLIGHWLSAAAHMIQDTGDQEMLLKANRLISEIARCQQTNGGRWAFGIPEKFLYRLKAGGNPWAPQYGCHKNMAGLLDMYMLCGNEQALEILRGCADWFYDFTDDCTPEHLEDMRDNEETGGMMELWADLYNVTHDPKHLTLMHRYERHRLVDPLLEGVDVLTNMHANGMIPEILGYARAYEVTGEERYRKVVEIFWEMAVTKRGWYATGGQTSGEIWTPMGELAARLGEKTQEHCVVYNMMRLADYLFRWTGESRFMDYNERALYNGIFAQGFCHNWKGDTTVTYYLPMKQGSRKVWGSKFDDFWCCHLTLLQANAIHHEGVYYQGSDGLTVGQYLPAKTTFRHNGVEVHAEQVLCEMTGGSMMKDSDLNRQYQHRLSALHTRMIIQADTPTEFTIALRAPVWRTGMEIFINGEAFVCQPDADGFIRICRPWHNDTLTITIGKRLTCESLPDDPDMIAFLDGPVCLAGLVSEEHMLYGDPDNPENSLLSPSDERHWQYWLHDWKTWHQPFGIEFKPLYQICDEQYTLYFPVERRSRR